jgi:transmembrane sensor
VQKIFVLGYPLSFLIGLLYNSKEMNQQEITLFFKKLSNGAATEAEKETFYQSLDTLDENTYQQLLLQYQEIIQNSVFAEAADPHLKQRIEESLNNWEEQDEPKVIKRWNWRRAASVAAVFLFVLIGSSIYFLNRKNNTPASADNMIQNNNKQDVLPGSDKAFLTLADASIIVLDEANNGVIAKQGVTKITKLGEKVSYDPGTASDGKMLYNTLTTPRGGQYQIVLSDGTQVWLNAGSSLRFPASFNESRRTVEVTGEAYFEVAKHASRPFIVKINEAEIQVLGTHFNVMAYQDEASIRTTLLEGAVKFVKGNASSLLKPGQQSQLSQDGQIKIVSNVDVEQVVAWKNGMFYFDNADIGTVMRQLSRWYDVEVMYQSNNIEHLFVGKMPRSSKLSDVLKALELTSTIQFEIQGRKIIVKP